MKGVLRMLTAAGDTTLAEWNTENAEETAKAKAAVEELIGTGHAVVTVEPNQPAQRANGFDPAKQEYIAMRPIVGG